MANFDTKPYASNTVGQPALFEQRLLYKEKAFSRLFDPTPLDTIYEKPFYGKVDIHGTPIYPSEVNMAQLPGPGLILALDFVVAAFKDFKEFMDKALATQGLFKDLFPSFMPRSATKSVHQLYNSHFVKNVFEVFANSYINVPKINRKIKNFNDLVTEFISYSRLMADQFPITKTGYIVSPRCPNAISGLFIELGRFPYGDDLAKYNNFISKPSFNRYLRVATAFGFYVDKNAPWRVAVNMDSPIMTGKHGEHPGICPWSDPNPDNPKPSGYMERFGVNLEDNSVFSSYFYESEYFSYESLKARLWNLYATLMVNPNSKTYGTIYKINNCTYTTWNNIDGNRYETSISEGARDTIPLDFDNKFQKEYTDEYFLPVYLKIRLAESHIRFRPRQFTAAMKKILDYNRAFGIQAAISYLGSLVQRTNIYEKIPIDKEAPYKIKYFGTSISSGLHSYKASDIIKKEKEPEATNIKY